MDDFRSMARDPKHRHGFEKLLYLAAQRGDADIVAERLSWGIDPNCTFAKGRTPLLGNVRSANPSAATVKALLDHGADPDMTDETGVTALDYARRKLARLLSKPRRRRKKSPSLDENDQLIIDPDEQDHLDEMRRDLGDGFQDYFRIWHETRLRAARRVFNDPEQVEKIVALLEAAGKEQ